MGGGGEGQKVRTKREDQILILNKISGTEKFKSLMKTKIWGLFPPNFFPLCSQTVQ